MILIELQEKLLLQNLKGFSKLLKLLDLNGLQMMDHLIEGNLHVIFLQILNELLNLTRLYIRLYLSKLTKKALI